MDVEMDRDPQALALRRWEGTEQGLAVLQQVFDGSPTYHLEHTGGLAGPDEARKLWNELPPHLSREAKLVFGILDGEALVGCADVLVGYPTAATAFIGLLLVCEPHQGKGLGRAAYALLERHLRDTYPELTTMRLAVVTSNEPALRFWHGVGFVETGERKPHHTGRAEVEVVLFEKQLPGDASASVSAPLHIERARRADRADLIRLLGAQYEELGIAAPSDKLEAAIDGVLEEPRRGTCLLARAGVEPIGLAYVSFTWSLEHGGPAAWLEELFVSPDHRGRAIGTRLLRASLSHAHENGCLAMDLEVVTAHPRPQRLYAREGFRQHARSRWVRKLP